jgi:single-strand DNA-binding protein
VINASALLNLGRDAEVRQTNAGPVLSFSGASTTKKGQEELTTWVRCSMFGKRGEALAKYLTKGSKVMVSGAMTMREYQDKNGATKTSLEMNVSELGFAGGKREGGSGGGSAPGGSQTQGGGFSDDEYGDTAEDDPIPF